MDPVIFYAIGTVVSVLGAAWGVIKGWSTVASRMTANKLLIDNANAVSAANKMRTDELSKELADIREANARDHGRLEAFNQGVIKAIESSDRRLSEAVSEMTGSIHHLTERLDGFIATIVAMNRQSG